MAYADTVVLHIAGLVAKYLGAAVRTVQMYPPELLPPQAGFPTLAVYRQSDDPRGPMTPRRYVSTVIIDYAVGILPSHRLEAAWGGLYAVTTTIDEAISRRSHPDYLAGVPLKELAAIHEIDLQGVSYGSTLGASEEEGASPAVKCTVRVVSSTSYDPADIEALTALVTSHRDVQDSPDIDHPGLTVARE